MKSLPFSLPSVSKYIILALILCAIIISESLHAQPRSVAKSISKFSAATLRIGVEGYLSDRLESTDEYTISTAIQEQFFEESYVVARCEAQEKSLRGNTNIAVIFSKNEEELRRVTIPVSITLKRVVPVLTRSVKKGEKILESDIEMKIMDVTYVFGDIAKNPVGMRASQNLNIGAVVINTYISAASSIQSGDDVGILIHTNGVSIKAYGKALDNGSVGKNIRVRRHGSNDELVGTIKADNTVVVSF